MDKNSREEAVANWEETAAMLHKKDQNFKLKRKKSRQHDAKKD